MAGIHLDESRVEISIRNWANAITSFNEKWEGNNLHIDEIDSLSKVKQSDWIYISLLILNVLMNQFKSFSPLILFLHIDLKYSKKKIELDKLSLAWLKENVSEYTPPSLHFTSLEYYNDFYEKELVVCKSDNSILEFIHSSRNLVFLYRTYFDEYEQMYSREIYVFIRD